MRTITPLLLLAALIITVVSCNRDDEQKTPINSNNRVSLVDPASLNDGIANISEVHTLVAKNNSSVMTYEYQAAASPPALDYGQTSATSILRNGNLVYIAWHTHDPANYNGFAKYSGAVTCYEVTGGTWTQVAQLEFDQMDIHEIAFGGPNELFIVGQSNPDASTYPINWGHRGAIVGKVALDGSGYPIDAGYIEKPLTSFGANSVVYVSASEIYVGTGATGGHLYKLNDALTVLDSTFLNNVKSVNADGSGKIGLLRGNRNNANVMAKFYDFNVGGALPNEAGGTDLTGITTFIHERNEGDYYNTTYLSSANQGLIEVDPAGPTVTTVYNAGLSIGVAADETNEVIYLAAQNEGLKVLHGTGTTNEYDVIGTFAPVSLNGGSWYVGDVVYDKNNVFITSGAGNVIFTEIYPDTYYLTLNMASDRLSTDPSVAGTEIWLTGGETYSFELKSSSVQFGVGFNAWEGVFVETGEISAPNTPTNNYMMSLNGVGDIETIDLSNQVGPLRAHAFFTPSEPTADDSGLATLDVKDLGVIDTTKTYVVNMLSNRVLGQLDLVGSTVTLPPGEYEFRITSSSVRFGPGQSPWTGAFLFTTESTTDGFTDPTDYHQMVLSGTDPHIIDLRPKTTNTVIAGYLLADDALGDESGSVTIEIRELHQ